jgi:hypothetical protein
MKYYKHYIVDNHKIKEAILLRQPLKDTRAGTLKEFNVLISGLFNPLRG